jgi:hypothetical protein
MRLDRGMRLDIGMTLKLGYEAAAMRYERLTL